ncbi:MAG TPA: HAMP domain-containing protein, partial [Gaiellaceae bacterium]|nr:HAMP domain-containing protein [Gaiellaceae bacterium]
MNPLRSVGARLSLALLLVVTAALGLVYVAVAPSLENRLVSSRLNDLERVAPTLAAQYAENRFDPDFFESAATTANARVVLLRPLSRVPPTLSVIEDSHGGGSSADVRDDPLALQTSRDLVSRRSTVSRGGERFAEVTIPVGRDGTVLLLSASLDRALGDVGLVRRRLLLAGGVALALVFAVGYAGSWMFARRLRRLERAAERIADGMFDEPVTDLGTDEVGELARAFERMRRRLAQLDHARREFIANASHELRTPVFSLGGFLELLDSEDLDEETRREFL